MIRIGEMVRRGGGAPMRVVDIFNGMARCVVVDGLGRISQRFHYEDDLTPLWLSLQPKTLWPEDGRLDEVESLKENQYAAARLAERRRLARKARKSNKLHREATA